MEKWFHEIFVILKILYLYLCAISRIVFVFIFIGADGYNVPNFVCDIYFNGQEPCFGGVLAIDGKTGNCKNIYLSAAVCWYVYIWNFFCLLTFLIR